MKSGELRSTFGVGALFGLISWSCCISAIVLAFLGLSAASGFFAMIQMKYHWWLVGVAFVSMDVAIYYFMKHWHGACDIKTIRHNWAPFVLIILFALAAYFVLQAVLPSLVELSGVPMGM
ncbi:MAG TPA: hypothetical protein VGE59_04460 [Patescibacteria group bacterium]